MKEMGESNMTCPNCNCKICLLCNDILDPTTPHNPDCHIKLYSKISDKNRNWLLKNTKDCPMCHAVYEKNQGCNHMTCTLCRPPTHFCYICGNILSNENPLKHYNDENSKCNNRLWDENTNMEPNNEYENGEQDENNDDNNNYNENDNENNINEEDSNMYDEEDQKEDNSNQIRSYNNFNRRNNNINNSNRNEKIDLTQVMFEKISFNDSYSDNYKSIYFKRKNNYKNNK